MKRIMIIGCGGSGKSTLACSLARKLDLPVHHLDRLFWQPGWKELPRDEWHTLQEDLCTEKEWVIDGNYGGTMDLRIAAADTIIFLDMPTSICLLGAFQRLLRFRGRCRPDMTEGCPERLNRQYLNWIWAFRRKRRPGILDRLMELRGSKSIVILRSRREVQQFLTGDVRKFIKQADRISMKHNYIE